MNPATNPFSPGAGTQPPELAGRQSILSGAQLALDRTKNGRSARSQMLLGLRGVGKTVLLNKINDLAEEAGYYTVVLEAPEGRRLAEMLVPPLRTVLHKLSKTEHAVVVARRGLAILRAFAGAFKVSAGDIEFGIAPETGTADSGDLESDLPELLVAVAAAAKAAGRAVALVIDEVQYLSQDDLAALIVSIHKISQKSLPLVAFGAGLPQLAALAGEAKSYAERLFDYPEVGPLDETAAAEAIRAPIQREGADITAAALAKLVQMTQGYPYFLQEFGSQAWNTAPTSPINLDDVERAAEDATRRLDHGFFRVRLDRLTPRERDYVRAMAELGDGPHRSGEIAHLLRINVSNAAPLRHGLIKKGMVYSPQHGDTAFTVPMFRDFVLRSMPNWKAQGDE